MSVGQFGPEVVLNGNSLTPVAMPSTSVTVNNTDNSAATLYTDATGATGLGTNVVATDARGQLTFYAVPGFYKLVYTDSVGSQTLTVSVPNTAATDSATYVPATVAVGTGIDPTGVSDSVTAIRALITGADAGSSVILPAGIYKLASTLLIDKTIDFGGFGATRTSTDGSDPVAGVEFVYTGTTGDAILVQPVTPDPPGSTNDTRISPRLHNFLIRGNKNVGGAASGGGLTLDGRASLPACAVSGFVVEDVHISDAKGDGLTIKGDVYEGRITGLNSTDNAGKGVNVGAVLQPGEILWEDIHTNDNTGDGAYLTGSSTHVVNRWSSSRNGGKAFHADTIQLLATGLQCESNAGSEVVTIEDCVQAVLIGLNVDYTEPSYTGTGLAITGASENVLVIGPEFSGTATTWDITTGASSQKTIIMGYRQSAATKVSFAGTDDVLLAGSTFQKGTVEFASDATNRTPVRVRGFTGQVDDLLHILAIGGGVLARVTAGGSVRSADDLIARLGAGSQTQIGEMGPSGEAGVYFGADTSLYRRTTNAIKTAGKLEAVLGLGVGNSETASTLGTVVKRMEIFNASGTSLGYIPIYDTIT